METVILETEGKKLKAIISLLKALDVPFKISNTISMKLDKRIRDARDEKNKGQLKEANAQNIWESIS